MHPSRLFVMTGLVTLAVAAVLVAASFASASTDREPAGQTVIVCGDNLAGDCDPEPPRFCSNCIFTVTPTLTPTASPTATDIPPPTDVPTATDAPPPTATPLPPGLAGDVNCDGVVDSKDAALILQFESGRLASLPCEGNGDVNGDGVIDSADALLVLMIEAASPA